MVKDDVSRHGYPEDKRLWCHALAGVAMRNYIFEEPTSSERIVLRRSAAQDDWLGLLVDGWAKRR